MTERVCIGGCGLAAALGDVFCDGCRSGYDRAPESILDYPDPQP